MASYSEKYYASINRNDGTTIRISVQRRSYSGTAFRMAGIQAMELEIGGGSSPVYSPIVKTMARFTVVDAHDIGSSYGGESCVTYEGGAYVKHGRWEEFYTNDPTLYRVQIKAGNLIVWSGYVTPDSWEESIGYRGSITVTARDMLGTLQDLPFNYANSLISLSQLIQGAFSACGCPMSCSVNIINQLYNKNDGSSIVNARFNTAAFEDMSWWDALNAALDALGVVVRYTGDNSFIATSLKGLPAAIASYRHDCDFVNRSGVRTLDPPVRDISSSYDLKFSDGAINPIGSGDLTQNGGISTYVYLEWATSTGRDSGRSTIAVKKAEVPASNDSEWQSRPTARPSLLHKIALPAHSSLIASGFTGFSPMYFIANSGGDYGSTYFESIGDVSMKAGAVHSPSRLVIRQDGALLTTDGDYMYLARALAEENTPQLSAIELYIRCQATNNTVYHYDGSSWVTGTEKENDLYSSGLDPIALSFEGGEASIDLNPPSNVTLKPETFVVCVTHLTVRGYLDRDKPHNGIIVPLAFSVAEPSTSGIATKYGVTTIYNNDYNVRITRSPKFGSVTTVLPGRLFLNALVDSDNKARADSWNWSGQSTGYPLEVMVQAQLLMHYAVALSIFTGTLRDKTDRTTLPGLGFTCFGRPCLLLRGVYDFTTGFIRSAAIREYKTWEEVWGSSFNPSYTIKTTRPANGGSSGGGSSSGGGGGGGAGGGSVTSVAMTVPTGLTVSGSPIVTSGTLAITLTSGYTIPTSANVTKGVTAWGWGNHAEAGYLTSISYNDVINALGFTPISGSWGSTYGGGKTSDLTIGGTTRRVVLNAALSDYATKAEFDELAEIVAELDDPKCWVAPTLGIIRGKSHYTGNAINPMFQVRHPLIGKTGVQVVLMVWRPRRGRGLQNTRHRSNYRAGWGEARGKLATNAPLTSSGSFILDTVRLFLLNKYVCSFELREYDFKHLIDTYGVDGFRGYNTLLYNFAFGGTWPQDMQAQDRPTSAKWQAMTRRWMQFGFAIRIENPDWTALELTNVAETTREVEDPQHQGRMIRRYLYSEVAPFRAFINVGDYDRRANTDKWDIGFNLGGPK